MFLTKQELIIGVKRYLRKFKIINEHKIRPCDIPILMMKTIHIKYVFFYFFFETNIFENL